MPGGPSFLTGAPMQPRPTDNPIQAEPQSPSPFNWQQVFSPQPTPQFSPGHKPPEQLDAGQQQMAAQPPQGAMQGPTAGPQAPPRPAKAADPGFAAWTPGKELVAPRSGSGDAAIKPVAERAG
jgi:hypothetical protein